MIGSKSRLSAMMDDRTENYYDETHDQKAKKSISSHCISTTNVAQLKPKATSR